MSRRNPAVLGEWGPRARRVVNANWRTPERWDRAAAAAGRRPRVFPSLCDPFEDRPDLIDTRVKFFDLMARTPHLDWLLLTKRPEGAAASLRIARMQGLWPLPNAWLGVSVEGPAQLPRLDALRAIPAALRFVSFEPLIADVGPVDLRGIHWAIAGGESGRLARPCRISWLRALRDRCRAADVPYYVKQLGRRPVPDEAAGDDDHRAAPAGRRPADRRGADPARWPPDLRVREQPRPPGTD
jgi:protein gp37